MSYPASHPVHTINALQAANAAGDTELVALLEAALAAQGS